MGCMGSSTNRISYNATMDKGRDEKKRPDFAGPFCNPNYGSFELNVEKTRRYTMIDLLKTSFEKNPGKKCSGNRRGFENSKKEIEFEPDFKYFSYREIWEMAEKLSKISEKLEFAEEKKYEKEGDYDAEDDTYKMVGIFARNCSEWIVTDLASQMNSITTVTFYATLGEEAFNHIMNQTSISTIFISPENIKNFYKYYEKYKFPSIKNIVLFDTTLYVSPEDMKVFVDKASDNKISSYSFKELMKTPSDELKGVSLKPSNPNTVLTICYTSGTTSLPKGVKMTQNNFASNITLTNDLGVNFSSSDVHFSFLPLAHVLERTVILYLLYFAGEVSFISGDPRKFLGPELKMVAPTFLVAVPRVLATFRSQINDVFGKLTGMKKSMAESAYATKKANYLSDGSITSWWHDWMIFSKVREKFGGRIKVIVVGSAPLPRDLATDIKIYFSVPIIEGYGMTETGGAIIGTNFSDHFNNDCGGIVRTCIFKLQNVPSLNYGYDTMDEEGNPSPTGEICVKGTSVTSGYFRNVQCTKETIDEEGWLHTGDVGRIVYIDQGLKIIDRVKEIFKLAQGEYIAPSKLEGAYSLSDYIEQICVHGDSHHTFTIGIIFPKKNNLKKFLVGQGLLKEESDLNEVNDFLGKDVVHAEIKKDLDKIAGQKNFNSLEKIGKLIISADPFGMDNGLLTDTLKFKRKVFEQTFKSQIEEAYKGN